MAREGRIMKNINGNFNYLFIIIIITFILMNISGCAMVHQKDREYLSDPVMMISDDPVESGLEGHNYPRREGSVGGSAGAGGGCGC